MSVPTCCCKPIWIDVRLDCSRDKPHSVGLLLPLDISNQTQGVVPGVVNGRKVDGLLNLSGTVSARAVGYTNQHLSRVVAYVKLFFICAGPFCFGTY